MRGRKRDAVVGTNHLRRATLFEHALEHREGEFLLCREQRLTGQEVATSEVSDCQRIAVLAIAEKKFAFVVGTPQRIRLRWPRQRGPRRASPSPASMANQVVAIQYGMDRTDGGQVRAGELLTKLFGSWALPTLNTPASARSWLRSAPVTDSPAGALGGSDH